MHCVFIPIAGKYFNKKPVYKCQYCGLTLGLERPQTKVICPVRAKADAADIHMGTKEYYRELNKNTPWELARDEDLEMKPNMSPRERLKAITLNRLVNRAKQERAIPEEEGRKKDVLMRELEKEAEEIVQKSIDDDKIEKKTEHLQNWRNDQAKNRCSQEQIDERLAICNDCEYYENNQCLQCGCAISRDRVFGNKLAFKDKECPIGKWKRIKD